MATATTENRGRLWPVLFALLGGLNIVDYFHKSAFQTADLLQGLGFLLMVPLAFLYPSAYTFRPGVVRVRPAAWTKWLSTFGIMLVISGFAVQWL